MDDSNIFLDNLGKLFGLAILSIITLVVRSSRAGTHRDTIRDQIEDRACVEPGEIEEVREVRPKISSESRT